MGKILYFDGFNGASGDMILGALLNLGLPLELLESELGKLGLNGYTLQAEAVDRQGLCGTNFRVILQELAESHGRHEHGGHSHRHRHLRDIQRLIERSQLPGRVKQESLRIFERLGKAEAKVHGTSLEKVHFHEVGAVDSIVDIVGACIGFWFFEATDFYMSPLALGGGTVRFSHGTWPVPAPATVELVRGFPVFSGPVQRELTTPTGAAIITTLVETYSETPVWEPEASGCGAGDAEFEEIPNVLRILLGRPSGQPKILAGGPAALREDIVLLEADIDNMDGEALGYFLEYALREGALDVYYSPLQMKKSRPGVLLSVLCRPEDQARLARLVFAETTTLGLRCIPCTRWVLEREFREIDTEFGSVRIKLGLAGEEITNVWPEYEDLKEIAERTGRPLKEIRRKVLASLRNSHYE